MGFLDETGLARFLSNLQSWISSSGVAAQASQDASGNVITSTYATKTELSAKADDSGVVHLTGAEMISGAKTFGTTTISASGNIIKTSAEGQLVLSGGPATNVSQGGAQLYLYGRLHADSPGVFIAVAGTSSSAYARLQGEPDGTLSWAGQPLQTSSDERLKTPLTEVPDGVLDAWGAVGWGQFRFLDAVGRKGDAARLHLGLIAQRVRAIFEERGLDACAYGILCHEVRPAVEDEPTVDLWTVRYAEALAMEAAFQRRRADRLEARIDALEEKMNG